MKRFAATLGFGLLISAGASLVRSDAVPSNTMVPARDRAIRLGRPVLEVIRLRGKPSAVRPVRLTAVVPEAKDTTGVQWIYRNPEGIQAVYLIGSDGKILEVTYRGAEARKYRVEVEPTPAPGAKP